MSYAYFRLSFFIVRSTVLTKTLYSCSAACYLVFTLFLTDSGANPFLSCYLWLQALQVETIK